MPQIYYQIQTLTELKLLYTLTLTVRSDTSFFVPSTYNKSAFGRSACISFALLFYSPLFIADNLIGIIDINTNEIDRFDLK